MAGTKVPPRDCPVSASHKHVCYVFATGPLKYDPETSSGVPNNTATLLGAAKQQFKSIGQLDLPPNLKACPSGGIVYDSAINDGIFRANDQFGHIGSSACRPYTYEPSRMLHPLLRDLKPNGQIRRYLEYSVDQYGYQVRDVFGMPIASGTGQRTVYGKIPFCMYVVGCRL